MAESETPLACPFCGETPLVSPENTKLEGNAWGEVACVNLHCQAKPVVRDGVDVADERGSDAYKIAAIKRWNVRAGAPEHGATDGKAVGCSAWLCGGRIVRRIIVIDNESDVRERTFYKFDRPCDWKRKRNEVLKVLALFLITLSLCSCTSLLTAPILLYDESKTWGG